MPWYVYSLAKGSVFYWGSGALLLMVTLQSRSTRRIWRTLFLAIMVIAIALIAISAAALPFWLYAIWAIATLAWRLSPATKSQRVVRASTTALLLITVAAVANELAYAIRPSLPAGSFPRLYVVGDSISAGLGVEHGQTWPVLIASEHHVEVVDLSQAGATLAQARKRLAKVPHWDGLYFLEIGGNDMLGHASPAEFARDLESLISTADGPGRKLVMLELPLLPFDNAYGVEQRRICRRHHVTLIPKRLFLSVLEGPDATVDGLHLTASGQRAMAEMSWRFVDGSLAADSRDVKRE